MGYQRRVHGEFTWSRLDRFIFELIVSLQKIENMPDKENTEKRGPGRPPKDEKDKKQPYVPTGKPRGRPPKNPKNWLNPNDAQNKGPVDDTNFLLLAPCRRSDHELSNQMKSKPF